MQQVLGRFGVSVVHANIELPEPQSYDVKQIAKEKVLYAFKQLNKPCLALDAGFFLDAWNGFPGAYAKFALEMLGVKGLLKLVENESKSCSFRHCLAFMDSSLSEPVVFEVVLPGTFVQPRGVVQSFHWSELSTVFVPEGHTKTLAELSEDDYVQWKNKVDNTYEKLAEFMTFSSQIVK
jgi:XTP/dITP diphosphohydrolase